MVLATGLSKLVGRGYDGWRVKEIEAVLFDLGDTIVHFETSKARGFLEAGTRPAYNRLIEWGFAPPRFPAYLRSVKRRFIASIVWSRIVRREAQLFNAFAKMHSAMGMKLRDEQMDELIFLCIPTIRQFFEIDHDAVGVAQRLEAAGFKLGLVSNTLFPAAAIDDVLRAEGLLEPFPIRVYSSDVGYMKPHPRIYETALERIGVPANRTVFIGDRIDNDVRGPARVGMKTMLMIRNGHMPRGRGKPDYVIRRLTEVAAALGA